MFASRSKPLAGLDITTSSIKLIELVPNGRSYRVECYAAEPSPPNSITEKSIVDADAVGEAVRRAVKRASTKASEVAIAISGDAAITKVIQMPRHLKDNDREAQGERQADQDRAAALVHLLDGAWRISMLSHNGRKMCDLYDFTKPIF